MKSVGKMSVHVSWPIILSYQKYFLWLLSLFHPRLVMSVHVFVMLQHTLHDEKNRHRRCQLKDNMLTVVICILWRYRNRHGIYFCDDMRIVINAFHSMTLLRKTSLMIFCDGRSMTILVTQRKCHHCNSVTKNHVFSDDNRSSWIVKSLVVFGGGEARRRLARRAFLQTRVVRR